MKKYHAGITGLIVTVVFFLAFSGNCLAQVKTGELSSKAEQRLRDVIMVIDNSGSMKKNDPGFVAKSAVRELAEALGSHAHLGIILFADNAELVMPLSSENSIEYSKHLDQALAKVDYSGSFTDIPSGIEKALYELKTKGRNGAEQLIVFMTDGKTDLRNKNDIQWRNEWLKEGLLEEAKTRSIRIFGIAFTDSSDFSLIQMLSTGTGGEYFRYITADELKERFSREIMQKIKPVSGGSTVTLADGKNGGVSTLLVAVLIFFAAVLFLFAVVSNRNGNKKKVKVPVAFIEDVDGASQEPIRIKKAVFTIGRDTGNDLCIDKDCVSATHATIEYRPDEDAFYLKDRRSTNHTYINDKEVNEGLLKGGDMIGLGTYKIRFKRPGQTGKRTILVQPKSVYPQGEQPEQGTALPEQAILVDVNLNLPRRTYSLTKSKTSIGRAQSENDIYIPDNAVSSIHAEVLYENGNFFVRDKRSSGGTFLNSEEMRLKEWEKVPVKWGDEIIIAQKYRLRLSPREISKYQGTMMGTPTTGKPQESGGQKEMRADACPNHPEHRPDRECHVCGKWFCADCVEKDHSEGGYICSGCKKETTSTPPVVRAESDSPSSTNTVPQEVLSPEFSAPEANDGKTIQKPPACVRHPGNQPKYVCSICKRACCDKCISMVDGKQVCFDCRQPSGDAHISREDLANRLEAVKKEVDSLFERIRHIEADPLTEVMMTRMLFDFAEKEIVIPLNTVISSVRSYFPDKLDATGSAPVSITTPSTINPGDISKITQILETVNARIDTLSKVIECK